MKINKGKLVTGVLTGILSLNFLIGGASASEIENNNIEKNLKLQESKPFLPVEMVNQKLAEENANFRVTASDMPTLKKVNEALKGVVVTKDNPIKEIDLGNGHSITISVSGVSEPVKSKNTLNDFGDISTMATQAVTAKGSISYKVGVFQAFVMSISDKYTYDNSTTRITSYQTTPTTSYSSGFTWKGKDTRTPYTYKYDNTAIDAVGDGKFTNVIYGSYGCHIELRFTATGNYYVHDSYFS